MLKTSMGGGYKSSERERRRNIICWILCVVLLIILLILLRHDHIQKEEQSTYLRQLAEAEKLEQQAEAERLAALEASDSFYQKLADGFDVNILIVGDSISEPIGDTSWVSILSNTMRQEYRVRVCVTNVSMGGNASYAGYTRVNALDDGVDYDLAVLCYGQNDSTEDFSLYYESMIRAIYQKYEGCSVISILESSQREYTEKMVAIQEIAAYYNIPVVDTIAAFNDSGYNYVELSDDGVHPNDTGKEIYAESILNTIYSCVEEDRGYDSRPEAMTSGVEAFDTFRYVSAEEFEVVDDRTLRISTTSPASTILGIDYTYQSGKQVTEIYVDGQLYVAPTVTFNYDSSQRHILIVGENCEVKESIEIVFEDTEALDGFYGLVFSNIG